MFVCSLVDNALGLYICSLYKTRVLIWFIYLCTYIDYYKFNIQRDVIILFSIDTIIRALEV